MDLLLVETFKRLQLRLLFSTGILFGLRLPVCEGQVLRYLPHRLTSHDVAAMLLKLQELGLMSALAAHSSTVCKCMQMLYTVRKGARKLPEIFPISTLPPFLSTTAAVCLHLFAADTHANRFQGSHNHDNSWSLAALRD